jgi:hypothetical protein
MKSMLLFRVADFKKGVFVWIAYLLISIVETLVEFIKVSAFDQITIS